MTTQLLEAKRGIITKEMETAASREGVSCEDVRKGIADGVIVITKNNIHKVAPIAIGQGLRTKINVNIGTSRDDTDIDKELKKLEVAVKYGADTIMDLSTGGDIDKIRKIIIKNSPLPVGTVPLYQVACDAVRGDKTITDISVDNFFHAIEKHGRDGVDFITVHCGVTREAVNRMKTEGRLLDIVSRGGALLFRWMEHHKAENPLYEQFDRLLGIAVKYDMTLSLGDGLRPGCIADATDRAQVQETIILGELAKRANAEGVQVIIEGPGHVPLDQVRENISLEKSLCHGAPFYVLGPLVTDIAPGYDHITSAIGGAAAASAGADFLCYVTPSEHLRLPTVDDVKEGVIASRIAAHAGDIAKGVNGSIDKDIIMARMRKDLKWDGQAEIAIDPEKVKGARKESPPSEDDVCTMCSSLCAIKIVK